MTTLQPHQMMNDANRSQNTAQSEDVESFDAAAFRASTDSARIEAYPNAQAQRPFAPTCRPSAPVQPWERRRAAPFFLRGAR